MSVRMRMHHGKFFTDIPFILAIAVGIHFRRPTAVKRALVS